MNSRSIVSIAKKEFSSFFSSLTAYIFFGTFLAVTLFVFFWVETYFARNIADVRPMFEWMPTLLIFLAPALTMRMWSEERRSGTLEFLLSSPVKNFDLVLGKFLACIALFAVAISLTLPLPISVNILLGQLDWGPVLGGYIATFFLAGAYIAIGLFVSARSDNQLVSLIVSILICGLFVLIGSGPMAALFDSSTSDILALIGSSSRFQSITRGVIDFRDLYYYISLMGLFLCLNVYGVEKLRWSNNPSNSRHLRWLLVTALSIANFVACNFWLQQISWARADLTQSHIYSISESTRKYLAQLKEPLLIRGYFSKKTHPYLAPLMPQLKDLLKEYQLAGHGKVKVEFVDPLDAPEIEQEAGEKYGIKPVQFQTSSKYQASIVNSYFDVLVSYGDQYELLDWKSLVEVKVTGTDERQLDVQLRNPEYDITSAIKTVFYNYKEAGNVFSDVKDPITFYGYISASDKLPAPLKEFKNQLESYLKTLSKDSADKFKIELIDPDANGGKVADEIAKTYGFSRMVAGLDLTNTFWFYMLMKDKNQVVQIPLDPRELNKDGLERNIKSALKRFASGSKKVVALMGKVVDLQEDRKEQKHFKFLHQFLEEEYALRPTDLKDGLVPADADILLMVAPEQLNETQVFAVDQFLMKGGTVILSSNSYYSQLDKTVLAVSKDSGLEQWLTDKGITIEKSLVLDPQCSAFPIPKQRVVGHYLVDETELLPYPFFPNIRGDGLNSTCGITSGISEISMPWSSPISIDKKKLAGKQITNMMTSSAGSWTDDTANVQPDLKKYPKLGFEQGTDIGPKLLSVIVEGTFDSSFKGKKSPMALSLPSMQPNSAPDYRSGVIEKSADSARIIVFASNSFASDEYLLISALAAGARNLAPVELVKNTLDWSLGDRDLLALRGRGHFARTLYPMSNQAQFLFECMNYGFALAGLGVVWIFSRQARVRRRARHRQILGVEGVKA